MSFWDRVKETFGGRRTSGDIAIEGDRVVLKDLERARTLASLSSEAGPKVMGRCEKCAAPLQQVVFTTAGAGEQREVWEACPVAVDGWLCRACGWSAMPRFISPEESVEYGRRGSEHAQSGDFDDAEFWFRRILGSWPGYGAGYADLAQVSLARADAEEDDDEARSGHRKRAEALFRKALASDTPLGAARVPLARTLALLGREAEARALLEELARDAEVAETHRAAGRALQEDIESGKGLFSRATEAARRLVLEPPRKRLQPDERRTLLAARELLRQAIERKSTFSAEWFLGKTELRLGQFEAAAEAFERACALDPQQADGQRELESAYLELGRNEDALEAAERALALRPTDSTLRCNLAFVLVLNGDLKRARQEATQAAAEDPADIVARNIVGLIEDIAAGRRKRPETLAEAEGRKA